MMARIVLDTVDKFFGRNHVIKNLSLTIDDGEFVTLLGPSGCGKTTTLRMIAGFESPTSGEIFIDDEPIFSKKRKINVPPEDRNIGMVFQNYAVWPHMTVFDNIAYPLKIRKMSKDEIRRRVEKIVEIVRLKGLEKRFPYQLSGGQQQRVAFARALVYSPKILLLDEPLSNLDAKLREEMRFEIKDIQRRLGITVVYVTHDQSEAMVMSDRIVVLKDGMIQQIGTPMEIYEFPENKFVADFIGVSNFLEGEVVQKMVEKVKVKLLDIEGFPVITAHHRMKNLEREVTVAVRPEDVEITPEGDIKAKIVKRTFLGNSVSYIVFAGKEIRIEAPKNCIFEEGENVKLRIKKAVVVRD